MFLALFIPCVEFFLLFAGPAGLFAFLRLDLRDVSLHTKRPSMAKGCKGYDAVGAGATSILLQDGLASWDASAADAVAVWSG